MNLIKKIGLLILIMIVVIISIFKCHNHSKSESITNNFKLQIGTYLIDTIRTNFGGYSKYKYSNLEIEYSSDSTFRLNERVPFIIDTIGKWNAGGGDPESWNWMYFECWGYEKYKPNIGSQFSLVWTKDSIFYINGCAPKLGNQFIQEIYFKKISRRAVTQIKPQTGASISEE
jgi:hypothetical protein